MVVTSSAADRIADDILSTNDEGTCYFPNR